MPLPIRGGSSLAILRKTKNCGSVLSDEIEKFRIELLLWEKDMAPYLGEFLMRKLLDEIVASMTYMDNARAFLSEESRNR